MTRLLACVMLAALVVFFCCPALAEEGERYILGPGDILEISVWQDESLKREAVISPDGYLSFPLAGDIYASGLTVGQLRDAITEKLKEYVPDATVTVMFLRFGSMSAFVIGKVNKPGEFPITMETTVMQLLAQAGGLSPFADSNDIMILRQQDGQTLNIPFDYDEVEDGENLEQNIRLRRGDVVLVP